MDNGVPVMRVAFVLWIFLATAPAFASGAGYESVSSWLAYLSTALVVLGIGGLVRLALLLQRIAVQVEQLQTHAGKVDDAFEKNTLNHERLDASIRRVEDGAREGREQLRDTLAQRNK
jgi:hypothetical protein